MMTNFDLSVLFLLQLPVILGACRLVSVIAPRIGQPPVVSEMAAGAILGPAAFGAVLPGWYAALFPVPSMTIIFVVAQLGIAERPSGHQGRPMSAAVSTRVAGLVRGHRSGHSGGIRRESSWHTRRRRH